MVLQKMSELGLAESAQGSEAPEGGSPLEAISEQPLYANVDEDESNANIVKQPDRENNSIPVSCYYYSGRFLCRSKTLFPL